MLAMLVRSRWLRCIAHAVLWHCSCCVIQMQLHTCAVSMLQDAERCIMLAGSLQPWPQPVHLLVSHSYPWRACIAWLKTQVPFNIVYYRLQQPLQREILSVQLFVQYQDPSTFVSHHLVCLCDVCLFEHWAFSIL